MLEIAIEHITRHRRQTIDFGVDVTAGRILYRGVQTAAPRYSVFSYDDQRDVVYRAPSALTSSDLKHETEIHFPEQLVAHLGQTPLASSIGEQVLIQPVLSVATRISPLSAMKALLERIADVNTALIAAENGSLTVLHRAGNVYDAHFRDESLETFLSLPPDERAIRFEGIDALEMVIIGSDSLTSDRPNPRAFGLDQVRTLRAADVAEFLLSEEPIASHDLIRDALPIATACLILDIARESNLQ